jgi:hypothetical protein
MGKANILKSGSQLADEGIALAVAHAGECWMDKILPTFHHWIVRRRHWFAVEEFRMFVEEHHPELLPNSSKAWGALPTAALARGWIARCEKRRAAKSPRTHRHEIRLYSRAGA